MCVWCNGTFPRHTVFSLFISSTSQQYLFPCSPSMPLFPIPWCLTYHLSRVNLKACIQLPPKSHNLLVFLPYLLLSLSLILYRKSVSSEPVNLSSDNHYQALETHINCYAYSLPHLPRIFSFGIKYSSLLLQLVLLLLLFLVLLLLFSQLQYFSHFYCSTLIHITIFFYVRNKIAHQAMQTATKLK